MVGLTREQRLERAASQTERASEVIDRDPEEALDRLQPVIKAAPNVGDITAHDMIGLFTQMQSQMHSMQEQMVLLMTGKADTNGMAHSKADTKKELDEANLQRKMTLESWASEPREPVWVEPDDDEKKIFAVTGMYPPRIFRTNGLEFPITPGQIANVPQSIARQVEHSQKKRLLQSPPQGLPQFPDPQRGQFLAGAQSVTIGNAGRSGEGRLQPEGLPPSPQPLGVRYDHNGQ